MGQVVTLDHGRETIVADARTTLIRAHERGGSIAEDADEALAMPLGLYAEAEAEATQADRAATGARARRHLANDTADAVVTAAVDDLFEAGGRRRNDPILAVAVPGGATPITKAALEKQPARMRLAAKVLRRVKHPRIAPAVMTDAADRIGDAAEPLATTIRETDDVIVAAEVADQVLTTLARLVRGELMALKRKWAGARMSEGEIHSIIPDRPDTPKKTPKADAPAE